MPTRDKIPEPVPADELSAINGDKKAEGTFFDVAKVKRLDLWLRTCAGWGALALAILFYLSGLGAIALFLGLIPCYAAATPEHWHIVVAVLVALFSVPTLLLLSVFRSTSAHGQDHQSLHEAVGNRVLNMLENVVQKRGD